MKQDPINEKTNIINTIFLNSTFTFYNKSSAFWILYSIQKAEPSIQKAERLL